jgi:fermentation-respiration switch protein FrsA (DUF1100 family)
MLVRERFDNLQAMGDIVSPTLIIHGQKDKLIPEIHAIELYEKCGGPSKLILPENMTHNEYDMHVDLVKPIGQFFTESGIVTTITYS